MSVWHGHSSAPLLSSADGELVSVHVSVDPRDLEELLDCLANLSFPVNPQIYHGVPTVVEFPAWEDSLEEVRYALKSAGFGPETLRVCDMLGSLAT